MGSLARKTGFRRLLVRGESVIADTGLLAGAILLVVMAGLALGTHLMSTARRQQDNRERVDAVVRELARELPTMVEQDRLTELRRYVQDSATNNAIASIRVVLGDGGVLAASTLDEIDQSSLAGVLPEVQANVAALGERVSTSVGELVIIADQNAKIDDESWALQSAIGVAGAVAMGGLWFVYRRLRKRIEALGAIGDALLAAADGETCVGALVVSDDLGSAAKAWNSLLHDRESLRERIMSERVDETLSRSKLGRGDTDDACDALWHGVVVLDEHGRIRYANGAAAVFLGRDREELRGLTLNTLVSDESLHTALRRVVAREVKRRISVEVFRTGDREDVLRYSVRPLRGIDGGDAIVMIEDVTQQRVASRASGGFVAQATHELRTPLTNIRLYVEEAIDLNDSDPGERSRCLNVINQETRRLERIVGDMLSVAEMESGAQSLRLGDVRLDRIMNDIRSEFEAQAQDRGVALAFDLPPKYPVFGADREKLTLVLHNLLGNAIKYTPSGGAVNVRVTANDSELRFEIRDTGIGIDQAQQERVFEAFFRTDEARAGGFAGTGLGLAIAKEIVTMHGGEISLDSASGKGSTFTLRIPNAPVIDRALAA